jgi:hypothetical protein
MKMEKKISTLRQASKPSVLPWIVADAFQSMYMIATFVQMLSYWVMWTYHWYTILLYNLRYSWKMYNILLCYLEYSWKRHLFFIIQIQTSDRQDNVHVTTIPHSAVAFHHH